MNLENLHIAMECYDTMEVANEGFFKGQTKILNGAKAADYMPVFVFGNDGLFSKDASGELHSIMSQYNYNVIINANIYRLFIRTEEEAENAKRSGSNAALIDLILTTNKENGVTENTELRDIVNGILPAISQFMQDNSALVVIFSPYALFYKYEGVHKCPIIIFETSTLKATFGNSFGGKIGKVLLKEMRTLETDINKLKHTKYNKNETLFIGSFEEGLDVMHPSVYQFTTGGVNLGLLRIQASPNLNNVLLSIPTVDTVTFGGERKAVYIYSPKLTSNTSVIVPSKKIKGTFLAPHDLVWILDPVEVKHVDTWYLTRTVTGGLQIEKGLLAK